MEFAESNHLGSVAAHFLIENLGENHQLFPEWVSLHRQFEKRINILMKCLDEVAEHFSRHSIPIVALKNAGIARGIFPCVACCPMGDIDVLIKKSDFLAAHKLVQDLGFTFSSRSNVEPADLENALSEGGGTEYYRKSDGIEVWLELQWRPIAGRWLRKDQEPNGDELIDRSVALHGTAVRLLNPTDNLLQVALHTAKHSYVRAPGLRLHTDVDRLVRYSPPDWANLVELANKYTIKTPVYFSLLIPKLLLQTPIPEWVTSQLAPPSWKIEIILKWLKRIDLFEPDEKKFNRFQMMVFHALLYDDLKGLAASVLDTEIRLLRKIRPWKLFCRGLVRMKDILLRYERHKA